MVCLGLEPRASEWKVQTKSLSYGGNHTQGIILYQSLDQRSEISPLLGIEPG